MTGNRFMAWAAAFAIALGVSCLTPATAAEGESAAAEESETKPPRPKSPIKVSLVDYVKDGEGSGTLKLAGIAIAGKEVYIYVDDKPLVRIIADDDGKWSVAEKTDLDDTVHKVRVEQYDLTTRMLAARMTFSMSLAKPGAGGETPAAAKP